MAQNSTKRCTSGGLRDLAEAHGLKIGAAVAEDPLLEDRAYAEVLAREFNLLTCENAMKFGALRPEPDRFSFAQADAVVAFARQNGIEVRGHTLAWHYTRPEWLTQYQGSRDDWISLLRHHIQTVVSYYKDEVQAWDVVNEGIKDGGNLRDSLWLRGIGPDYMDLAFWWAHEVVPEARLFYNDYNADGINQKSDRIYALVGDMLRRGVPVHGIGLQMHLRLDTRPPAEEVAANVRRFNELGLEVQVTEMDIAIEDKPTQEALREQAQVYGEIMKVCLGAPRCTAFVMWGFTDRYSWIPHYFPGRGAALIFDEACRPKPAYEALREALANKTG